jgi:hypothetical protein
MSMKRSSVASILTGLTAGCFFVVSAMHASAQGWIMELAQKGPAELVPHLRVLWWSFSLALVVLGMLIALHTRSTTMGRRAVLAVAGIFPLGNAVLMFAVIGYFPPVAILAALGLIALIAAAVCPPAQNPA